MDKIILDHYTKLAKEWGLQGHMSMQDQVIRERETKFIIEQTKACLRTQGLAPEQAHILDLGCGNGFLLEALWMDCAPGKMTGIEFVPALVDLAQSRRLPGVEIRQGDMREADIFTDKVHIIITERSVVNLLSWEDQKKAFTLISQSLRPGGHYIMVESFHEPWLEMNAARREIGQEDVPVSPHNRYLREACLETLAKLGLRTVTGVEPQNALSTHFFLSRVLKYALGERPNERVWQFLSHGLPPNVANYSPILWRVFQKDVGDASCDDYDAATKNVQQI